MNAVVSYLRADLHGFGGYRSAACDGVVGGVRLNANESPWPNDSDADAVLRSYPAPQPRELVAAIAELHGVECRQVLLARGSDEGIDLLLRASCEPGNGAIVVAPPVFGMYAVCARLHGARVVEVALRDTTRGFRCEPGAMAAAARANRARLLFLCSPGNPTGEALSLRTIARLARELEGAAIVVVDEAYGEFSAIASAATLLPRHGNLAVLRTLSKAHALAGARVGCVLASEELVGALRRCQAPYPLPVPSVSAALAALSRAARARTARQVVRTRRARDVLAAALRQLPGVSRVYPSQGNFLLVRLRNADAALARLADAGITVRDMRAHPQLHDAVRITVGTAAQNTRVVKALAAPPRGGA